MQFQTWLKFTAYNFGTVNAGATNSYTFVVPGAAEFGWLGIGWELGAEGATVALGIIIQHMLTSVDEVTIFLTNGTAGNIIVGPLTLVIKVNIE